MTGSEENQLPPEENFDYEEESLVSMILKNGFKILLGLIVVIGIGAGIFFAVQFLTKQTTQPNNKQNTANNQTKQSSSNSSFPETTTAPQASVYTDSTYSYSISLPTGWEAFKRISENGAYQTGIRPSGSLDVPIVINTQEVPQNTTLQSVVKTRFDDKTYEEKTINGQKALYVSVKEAGYDSYFFLKNGVLYEISYATGNPTYLPFATSLVSSFKLSR